MNLPYMTAATGKNRKQIIAFAGLNYGQGAGDGELAESWGLSSARFPCLSQRDGRKTAGTYTSPTGLYARGKLCVVDGTDFLYDGKVVGHVTAGEKQFATINTKIVIFPDKVYYDTEAEEFGMLAAEYPGFPGDVTFTANTLTVPEQSYIDQAAENAETKGSVAADTSITAYTGASVDKTTGALTMSGGTPELLTENFGTRRFFDAVGGTDGERYYISMRTEKGDWELYVFDTLRAIWLREDATHALDWAYLDGTLYFLDGATGKLMTTGQDYSEEGLVNWSATLCQMDETSHGRKCYSKLYLRADLDAGAWLKVEISTDGKPFRQVFSTHNERAKTLQVPILPVRCDNFRIRLSGKGGCLVKSIIREFALGSEY